MSVSSSRYSTATTINRMKKNSAKSSLLHDNVRNYPHREGLVKKSSPTKAPVNHNNNLSSVSIFSGSLDQSALSHKSMKGIYNVNNASTELISEMSIAQEQSIYNPNAPRPKSQQVVTPSSKRGSLLGPFKFMTDELEENKLSHYNKGHLETVMKQLDLLQCLLQTKFQEERKDKEDQILKAWMVVGEKEEEAFSIGIKERTVEEVHNCHHRLVDMVSACLFAYVFHSLFLPFSLAIGKINGKSM